MRPSKFENEWYFYLPKTSSNTTAVIRYAKAQKTDIRVFAYDKRNGSFDRGWFRVTEELNKMFKFEKSRPFQVAANKKTEVVKEAAVMGGIFSAFVFSNDIPKPKVAAVAKKVASFFDCDGTTCDHNECRKEKERLLSSKITTATAPTTPTTKLQSISFFDCEEVVKKDNTSSFFDCEPAVRQQKRQWVKTAVSPTKVQSFFFDCEEVDCTHYGCRKKREASVVAATAPITTTTTDVSKQKIVPINLECDGITPSVPIKVKRVQVATVSSYFTAIPKPEKPEKEIMITAIRTLSGYNGYSKRAFYNGTTFMSILEACFAQLLDTYKIQWVYEPVAFTINTNILGSLQKTYKPDFYLPAQGLYIELKPHQPLVEEMTRCEAVSRLGHNIVLMYGKSEHYCKLPYHHESIGRVNKKGQQKYITTGLRGLSWVNGELLAGDAVFVSGAPAQGHMTPIEALSQNLDSIHIGQVQHTSDNRWESPVLRSLTESFHPLRETPFV